MKDIFDNTILCNRCHLKMKKIDIDKNGFILRAVKCDNCGERIIHPQDLQEYEQFSNLKNKTYRVKLRIVGNSYAVSIPKEIVQFMQDQERLMDDMVRLCFEGSKRLSLQFSEDSEDEEEEPDDDNEDEESKNKEPEEYKRTQNKNKYGL